MSYITGSDNTVYRVRTRRKKKAKEKVNAFVSPIVWKLFVISRGGRTTFQLDNNYHMNFLKAVGRSYHL